MLLRAASTARRRWPFLMIGALTLSSVLFAGLWLGAASAGSSRTSAAIFSNVKINKFDAIDGGGGACAGFSWSDVPGASKTFNLSGTATRPVLATVSLQVSTAVGGEVRLLVDGGQQGVGSLLRADLDGASSHNEIISYTFLTLALAPGSHTAKIQFRIPAGSFCADHWTMAILHA
jgi:hypothetical protein